MKNMVAHEEVYRHHTIEILYDDDPENPREWDNFGTMVCWHNRYTLGDEQPTESPVDHVVRLICQHDGDFEERADDRCDRLYDRLTAKGMGWAEAGDESRRDREAYVWAAFDKYYLSLPLYLYDHSGITMSVGGFEHVDSVGWDWGQVGFIYVSKEDVRKEYGIGRISPKARERAVGFLRGEVKSYDDYLTGNCYGYRVKDVYGDELDACWGFLGDYEDYCLSEARGFVDWRMGEKVVAA